MITLNFYTLTEKQPKHDEEVILLLKRQGLGVVGFDPYESTIEWLWEEFDSEGICTGDYINYQEGGNEDSIDMSNYRLIMVDSQSGTFLDENNCYWCPIDEFYNAVK